MLQSLVSIVVGTYWVSPSRRDVCRLRGIPCHAVPRSLSNTGLSSLALFLLFRVPSCLSCHRPQTLAAFLGVLFLLRDIGAGVHISIGVPMPTYVPPSVFFALSTIYSSLHFAGLFRPTTAYEISLQGFPPTISRLDFRPRVPSCR
mgnify:CR=1 FL=1